MLSDGVLYPLVFADVALFSIQEQGLRAGPVCLDSFYPKISGALRV